MTHDFRVHTALFVDNITADNGASLSRQNVKAAFSKIADLVSSRHQVDVDSGMDTLYVLTRALDRKRPG